MARWLATARAPRNRSDPAAPNVAFVSGSSSSPRKKGTTGVRSLTMLTMKTFVWWLICALLVLACGSSSSSSTTPAGGGCTTSATCNGGVCATSQDFPGGYCTQGCQRANPTSCPSGSVCIDDASGVPADAGISAVCYQACQSSNDCGRAGYACLEKSSHMVCRNAK